MCGIVGIISKNAKSYREIVDGMKFSIRHRGPDGDGTVIFDHCILGHVRLSIIDLVGGKQPMRSINHNNAVTFNGEIYNFLELKRNLNYEFQTKSDTEVLLALYEQESESFLNKLSGMFAFALWDQKQEKLFCARDRFGEKPFYYAFGKDGEFIFASEIKAIVKSGLVDLTLDKESVAHYLQRLYVPVKSTIYKNIHVLPAAHKLIYENNKIRIEKYWTLPKEKELNLNDAVDQFSNLFEKAVERQLIADVETGAFLSGGLDSSSIVAMASKYNQNLKTFSFGFDHKINELPFAKEVAQRYNTKHFEFLDKKFDLAELLIKMQTIYDEPFADSSNIPTYIISKHAREHVKVVLSGDGGDELLGGYTPWYRPLHYMQVNKKYNIPKFLIAKMIAIISKKISLANENNLNYYIDGVKSNIDYSSIAEAKAHQNIYFTDDELSRLNLPSVKKNYSITTNSTVSDALRIDLLDYMPGDILTKLDRASMANSLEARAPFLDSEFASFCISLPSSLKINSVSDKIIMREAFNNLWPNSIQKRDKQGFGAPVDDWLKREDMKKLKKEFLEDSTKKIFNLLEYNEIQKYLIENNYNTWILLVLSIWMETHEFI